MAATNYTPIQLYYSTTASAAPTAGNLTSGELAINITDGKLYYKDNGGVVQVIATKGAGTIGGSTTQIQYNNAGALAGSAAMTFNSGTNTVTLTTLNLTNALGATYGGTAQSAYAQGDVLYASAANTLSKLGIGTVNYILTSTGSVPQWSAPSSITVQTATNLAGGAGGSVPYQSAADTTTFLAIGAANRVMTSSGTAPQWVTALTGLTGVSSSSITNTSLTSGRLVYSSTAGLEVDSANLTFDGTTLSATGYSTTGLSTLVKTVTIGNSNFSGTAVFAAATPAKLYIGTGTVTDTTSAIGATNATGAISSLAITPIAATNTSVTYTNASTLYIAGAPSAGTNVTITNPYSLYIAAGAAYFGGAVDFAVTPSYSGGTANGVMYLNGSKQITTGTTFTYNGQQITAAGSTASAFIGYVATTSDPSGYSGVRLVNTGASGREYQIAVGGNTSGQNGNWYVYDVNAAATRLSLNPAGLFTVEQGAVIQGLTVGRGANALAGNTALGARALAANTSGTLNTATGNDALLVNTTGRYNSAFGNAALTANTTGSDNTALGMYALVSNTTGLDNTAVGYLAGFSNTTSGLNVAIGSEAMYTLNTAAGGNVAVGQGAMRNVNHTAGSNVAIGLGAMLGVAATGAGNIAIGQATLYSLTTGSNNTIIGGYDGSTTPAGRYISSGSANVGVGSGALGNTLTANNNTAVGYLAGFASTTGAGFTAVGTNALYANNASDNTAVGNGAMYGNTTGTLNVAVGSGINGGAFGTLAANTTGSYNTALGVQALRFNTVASYNTAVGYQAGYNGAPSGTSVNTYIGAFSGVDITTGTKNTILGAYGGNQLGLDIRTSNSNVVLSDGNGNVRLWIDGSGALVTGVNGTNAYYAYTSALGSLVLNNGQSDSPNIILATANLKNYGIDAWNSSSGNANQYLRIVRDLQESTGKVIVQISEQGTVSLGNITTGANAVNNGTGIAFPPTQNASTDANTLDDYEEGTWSPTFSTTGTGYSTLVLAVQQAYYVKVGRLVNIWGYIAVSSVSGGTGAVTIVNLPFNTAAMQGGIQTNWADGNWGGLPPTAGHVLASNSIIYLINFAATQSVQTPVSSLIAGSQIIFNGSYYASA